jgi:NAD(P)-dependent dehydrogenase (short-subunit alcohol dehydrogenase family)
VKAILFGASGGLATALARRLLDEGWNVDLVTRSQGRPSVDAVFSEQLSQGRAGLFIAPARYSDFVVEDRYDAVFFTQALFDVQPLEAMEPARIEAEISVGLSDPILLTRSILAADAADFTGRRDFCYIGSTSSYAGFRNTSVYCAVKHGLLGFVRAMNDEYVETETRFWLFSMGTMKTDMGAKVRGQDPASFLEPQGIAARIVAAIADRSNIFEPEVILRRRTIRLAET